MPPAVDRRQIDPTSQWCRLWCAAPFADRGTEAHMAKLTRVFRSETFRFFKELGHNNRKAWMDENRSEEHTSELQSPCNLVCRLRLEKKNGDIMSVSAPGAECGKITAPGARQGS